MSSHTPCACEMIRSSGHRTMGGYRITGVAVTVSFAARPPKAKVAALFRVELHRAKDQIVGLDELHVRGDAQVAGGPHAVNAVHVDQATTDLTAGI